jgi:hypothetical protein
VGVKTPEWGANAERRGVEGLGFDLARQRVLLGQRSPTYQRALDHLRSLVEGPGADPSILQKLERTWRERAFHAYYDRPLLLLASLRHDAIVEGPAHPLHRAFAVDDEPDDKVVTREAIAAALGPTRLSVWLTLATRRVQTNEVSRAIAWLWPAALAGCEGGKRPLAIFDVGCAAGLNLVGEQLPASWSDEGHKLLPVVRQVAALQRLGFDPSPLDVRQEDDVTWMRACLWPGEIRRLARFDVAVSAMRSALAGPEPRPRLHTVPAHLVPGRLDSIARVMPPNALLLAYQTLVRGYIGREHRATYERDMQAWVMSQPPGRACWVELEINEANASDALPAELVAHVNGGSGAIKSHRLARCGYHPDELTLDPAGQAEFVRRMKI